MRWSMPSKSMRVGSALPVVAPAGAAGAPLVATAAGAFFSPAPPSFFSSPVSPVSSSLSLASGFGVSRRSDTR